ncbi:nitroreductase family deazaflavin-dependent oxidoreductase [Streptomyces sp. NPDC001594]|uniref:nitroreductase family deazaflavin-dependent oxidoreductase n=1 Tax=Streptomyces sp. NPDC001594 TaxID=3364590 RepID=UPI0036A0177C
MDNRLFRVLNRIGFTRGVSAVMRAVMVPVDTALQMRSAGRLSVGRPMGVPSLLLTTVGCRSGQLRPTPLFYVGHDGGFAVVGSNFGQGRHPDWTANLLKTADAFVATEGRRMPVKARLVTGTEREEVWRKILELSSGYQTYNDRSGRDLRIFHLQPIPPQGFPQGARVTVVETTRRPDDRTAGH